MSEPRRTDDDPPADYRGRRAGKFTERLSMFMAVMASAGGFYVLIDPRFSATVFGHPLSIGGDGFSPELKGAVVTIMLIGGWTAVKEFWLGSSAGGQTQSESMSRIAEASAPVAAAAAAAAVTAPAAPKADEVKIDAPGARIDINKP